MTQMIPRPQTAQKTLTRAWWKEAVAYQIYPRSFYDANNDGIGDIPGIIAKLDYLKDLGVDVLWICPMFKSPNDDNGYDISDYEDIMDEFGTMADFDLLMEEAHKRDIKVLLDLVVNHTSDEHPWFLESRSSTDNDKRDWYIWKDAVNGGEPNNWESIFGGSAWEYDEKTEQYFLHVFSRRQPDLNWRNKDMRQAVYTMINWWLDKGVDGFRIDAISHINKDQSYADLPNPLGMPHVPSFEMHMNVDGIHEYLEELKNETFSKYDIMTVGEANGVTPEEADLWVGEENGKMNMVFQFEHMDLWRADAEKGVDVVKLKNVLTKWQKGLEETGWNALYLENHDKVRSVSLWGDEGQYWKQSAKSLAMMYFFMQGTPFIYQGQEIGMTNVQFPDISDYDDVATKNMYDMQLASGKTHEEIMEVIWNSSRDNSRTPMQWTNEQNGGFSDQSPWFGVNPNFADINVASQQADEDSILNFYKRMIQIRKMEETLIYGEYDLILPEDTKVYGYTRTLGNEQFLIVTNLKGEVAEIDTDIILHSDNIVLANYETTYHEGTELTLQPFEARLYRVR